MDLELVKKYDSRVPRYTSYPTAPHFHDGVNASVYRDWLAALEPDQALSLYLHVPFCHEMCWYCGCHTKVVAQYKPVAKYVGVLHREMDLLAGAVRSGLKVSHVHWGGGTPTMVSGPDMVALMDHLRDVFNFGEGAEIAVETDPRTLTEAHVAAMAEAGVTRASLGVQDFDPDVQRAINRIQPYDMTARATGWLRDAGIKDINFDLMYGLPLQTTDLVRKSVDQALEMAPQRIALFGYAHVPWMKTHQKMIRDEDMPDPAARIDQAEAAADQLVAHGYRRIGLDHFCHPDDAMTKALDDGALHRNFQGYTTDRAPVLLGLGASAIGCLPQGYVQNAVPFHLYDEAIEGGELAVARGVALGGEDEMRRTVIERLMCDLTVDLAQVAGEYGYPADHFASELAAAERFVGDGLAEIDGAVLTVTEEGRALVRSACALFDQYLDRGLGRHSKAI